MRIRSRLLLLVAVALLPALIVCAAAIAYIYREQHNFNRESVTETARALALALEREMARRESILLTLAASPALKAQDLRRFYDYASEIGKDADSAIILSDLEGRQIVNTRLAFGAALPPMLAVERESRARLGNELTIISDLYLPPAGLGPHSFAIQVPVRRDGKAVAFITMASFAGQLQSLIAAQRLPAGWNATIVDRNGVVVARNMQPEKFVGTAVRAEMWARFAQRDQGAYEGTSLAGVPATAFFSRAQGSGWLLLVGVPHSTLYGPAWRISLIVAGLGVALLGLGLAAALVVARRISGPVEALREAARALGVGEPVSASPSGTAELDAVGAAMRDASERLRSATAELERRVAEAVASFEQSQRALMQAQKLEALGRLTGGIAHDFNNVLQTLTASLDALKLRAPEDQRTLLARCERAVTRGTGLARQLMAFGRVQELRAQTIDTAARLGEARHLFSGALPADVRLELDLAPRLWPVRVDPSQLELALLNLVINARDAMPSGGNLTLRGGNQAISGRSDLEAGEYVALSVSDTGEGMSEEVMARAFEPFYTTKGLGKGAGMGLPQAYGFARQNGGTVTLESRRGQGTTAVLYLPRAREPFTEEPAAELPARAAGRGRVLLVEDDEEVRETVGAALRGAGFEIHAAASADEALLRFNAGERYDAMLTDIVMPGALNGIDLASEVRRRHPRTGVVVATGYSDRPVHLEGVQALPKPYNLQQAVDALNASMEK